ncbi:hypothetical protein TB1_009217 [Malus domestica]
MRHGYDGTTIEHRAGLQPSRVEHVTRMMSLRRLDHGSSLLGFAVPTRTRQAFNLERLHGSAAHPNF